MFENTDLLQTNAEIIKTFEPRHYKVYFLKQRMCFHVHTKLQISNMILTRFRQYGVVLSLPTPTTWKLTPKKPSQIKVKSIPNKSLIFEYLKKSTLMIIS